MPPKDTERRARETIPPRTAHTDIRQLSPDASVEQIMFALQEGITAHATQSAKHAALSAQYATLAAECRDHMKRRDTAVDVVSAEVVVQGAAIRDIQGRLIAIEQHLEEDKLAGSATFRRAKALASVPPTREQSDSSHDLAHAVGKTVAEQYEADMLDTRTPPPTPESMGKITETTVQAVIKQLKDTARNEIANQRNDNRRLLVAAVTAGIAALGGMVTALIEHFYR